MASGIRDKVVILGMGCSRFGERWDCDAEDLMVEAFEEAMGDAGVEPSQIQAAWLATAIEEQHVGKSGIPLSVALRLGNVPSPGSRITAPRAPRPSAARSTPWRPAPATSRSRSAARS
jgi:Acetyl-CoA acetyltransferase